MSERIIIGEGERAGLPISAPITTPESNHAHWPKTSVRWVRKGSESSPQYFVLECFDPNELKWFEVPCVIPEEHKTQ